jgi:acetyl-CoA carboxylase biotin carboxyl carrier protein
MKLQEIQKLISMLEQSGVNEIELETDGMKLRLSKAVPPAPAVTPTQQPPTPIFFMAPPAGASVPAPAPAAAPANPASQPPAAQEPPAAPPQRPRPANAHEVHSPMVGTFYRSPAPGADPFVKIGDRVKKGQTLCIIEAMKLMNEIECEIDGTVVDVLVENAQPVEYGEPLLLIEPLG